MNDLDKELIAIFNDCFGVILSRDNASRTEKALNGVKQILRDEIDAATTDAYEHYEQEIKRNGFMTGQEWYERFFKEVGKFSQAKADAFARNPTYLYEYMVNAAKRTSGLNNEKGE